MPQIGDRSLDFVAVACWRFMPPRGLAPQPATVHIHTDEAMAVVQVMTRTCRRREGIDCVLTGEFQWLNAKE
ncbi:hypothetical protein B5E41_13735 [Rhizobium esperanzae]|uniref:Uncharacterized protein n=1 Tax=Rhizobium esperanzae TaxID=1967781 RepID=A0A246DV39_9HYPH|nr:hypothetical protein [Rhizobium esperanzae]OWO94225.1 hypothetical protein B5E41_13735 [Rhizobium esperanzae]